MSVPDGAAATGLLGWDTNCGTLGYSGAAATAIGGAAHENGGSYDFIIIPSGTCAPPSPTIVSTGQPNDRYCGTELNCVGTANTIASTPDATVCTNMKPFKIGVHTDGIEFAHPLATAEATAANSYGFSLNYFMSTNCIYYKITAT